MSAASGLPYRAHFTRPAPSDAGEVVAHASVELSPGAWAQGWTILVGPEGKGMRFYSDGVVVFVAKEHEERFKAWLLAECEKWRAETRAVEATGARRAPSPGEQ